MIVMSTVFIYIPLYYTILHDVYTWKSNNIFKVDFRFQFFFIHFNNIHLFTTHIKFNSGSIHTINTCSENSR